MSRTVRRFSQASVRTLAFALVGLFSAAAQAASINYGDFGPAPPGLSFLAVAESSGTDPVPLFGPPDLYAVGLDFDPIGFVATSAGGGADTTEGQLNNAVVAANMRGISGINVLEAGDYALVGGGSPATSVVADAIVRVTITQVNALPVPPINVPPGSASIGFALPGPSIAQPWSIGIFVDVGAQLLGSGYPSGSVATKVEVVINNSLTATSEPNSAAFIAKKEFLIDIIPVDAIPEPGGMALADLALCGLGLVGRKRRLRSMVSAATWARR